MRLLSVAAILLALLTGSYIFHMRSSGGSFPKAGVVFTGGHERFRQGLRLLDEERIDQLLISGLDAKTADFIEGEMTSNSVDRALVTFGREARTTFGNAAETACWLQGRNVDEILLITSADHMPRSVLTLRRVLPRDIEIHRLTVSPRKWRWSELPKFAMAWIVTLLPPRFWLGNEVETCPPSDRADP